MAEWNAAFWKKYCTAALRHQQVVGVALLLVGLTVATCFTGLLSPGLAGTTIQKQTAIAEQTGANTAAGGTGQMQPRHHH